MNNRCRLKSFMKIGAIRNDLSEKGEGSTVFLQMGSPKGTVTEADFISLDKITDSTGKAEINRTSIKRKPTSVLSSQSRTDRF